MLLHNLNHKIIGVANVTILPGETKEIPAGYEDNPVVNFYVAKGWVELVKDSQPVAFEAPAEAKAADTEAPDSLVGSEVADTEIPDNLVKGEVTGIDVPRGKRSKKNAAKK